MKLMEGKKGVIFGVSNTHGIAYAIAKQLYEAGADIADVYKRQIVDTVLFRNCAGHIIPELLKMSFRKQKNS